MVVYAYNGKLTTARDGSGSLPKLSRGWTVAGGQPEEAPPATCEPRRNKATKANSPLRPQKKYFCFHSPKNLLNQSTVSFVILLII